MTAQLRAAFRAVVLPLSDASAHDTPTRRLLGQLGHDVARAQTPHHALELMTLEHTDLLVVDISDSANRELFEAMSDMPESKRPNQVAVFSDSIDTQLREWRRKVRPVTYTSSSSRCTCTDFSTCFGKWSAGKPARMRNLWGQ